MISRRPGRLAPDEIPADTRPGALVLSGMRRGLVQVFLPVALAGQAVAWLGYLISGAYGPWSWIKIGLAYTFTSVRVPFEVTARGSGLPGAEDATFDMVLALGAFTAAVVVLAFRAGRDQARGLETKPARAAAAGASIGPGFALPMFVAAFAVRLGFPRLGITVMEPVLWAASVMPLVIGGVAGVVGGLGRAREALEKGGGWRARTSEVARTGALACWWGLVLSTIAFLLLAAVEMGVTKAYGRFIGRAENAGAIAVVHHALVLPNQSALTLGITMGVPAELQVGEDLVATAGLRGLEVYGPFRGLIGDPTDPTAGSFPAPRWYWVFLLVPAAATLLGGRVAGEGARSPRSAAATGALAAPVFAGLCVLAAWFASFSLPLLPGLLRDPVSLGQPLGRLALVALAWGLVGCSVGAAGSAWLRTRRAA